ncbi:MAG: hypothetical protein WC694_00780 [Candidatus Paceibacterota bacterium]|jgi:hypothetical protein
MFIYRQKGGEYMKIWCDSFKEDFDKLGRLNNCSSLCDGECVVEIEKPSTEGSEPEADTEGLGLA